MSFLIGDQLKVGVIGAGRWGKKHIDEYCHMKDVELLWASDLVEGNLKECQEQFNAIFLKHDLSFFIIIF